MNLYKRILKKVEGFRDLTEEDKGRVIYLYKHKYIGYALFLKETILIQICLGLLGFVFSILGVCLDNDMFSYISIAIILLLLPSVIVDIYIVINLIIIKINRYNRNTLDAMNKVIEQIANIRLLNHKVITCKNWRKIKRYDKYKYRYLRSEECNHECYDTTKWLADFIKDPEIKIVWLGVDDIWDDSRWGHAILKKGDWVYDTNLRRTYKFEDYIKTLKAEIFKEFSLEGEEYFRENSYEDVYQEFGIWCKERGIRRATED